MKRCPYCAEEIQDEAVKCRYCGSDLTAPLTPGAPGQPSTGQPPGPMVATPRNNGMAIASLVLGILWIYGIGSILALIFGYLGKRDIDRSNGTQGGRGMAIAGIVLGYLGIALVVAGILLFSTLFSTLFGMAERFAEDTRAQDRLSTALVTAGSIAKQSEDGSFADVTPETLEEADPVPVYTDGPSSGPATISVAVSTTEHPNDTITLATHSDFGPCISVRQILPPVPQKQLNVKESKKQENREQAQREGDAVTTYGRQLDVVCDADAVTPTDETWVSTVEWTFPD